MIAENERMERTLDNNNNKKGENDDDVHDDEIRMQVAKQMDASSQQLWREMGTKMKDKSDKVMHIACFHWLPAK
jgi:hypothetical protein